jgi:CHAP domain
MTTIVLTTNLLFGQRPKGEMHLSSLETAPEESFDGIGGMFGLRAHEPEDERAAPHAPDHQHHRPHEHRHGTAIPRPDFGHHHRPFDRAAGHHHRPFEKLHPSITKMTPEQAAAMGVDMDGNPLKTGAPRHGGSRSFRNRNPGNIKYSPFAKRLGAIGQDAGGFAIFPDDATGEKAHRALWNTGGYSNVPIGRALSRWGTGPIPGIDPSKKWSDLSPDQQQTLLNAQRHREGWSGADADGTHGLSPEHHGRYRGELEIGGDTFPFVSGGRGGGSSPPGDRLITGQSFGGRLGGGEGRFATSDVYDPQAGRTRSLVRIHASSSSDIDRAVSSGCFAVDRSQWPRLKQELNAELAAHGGRMVLHVGEDGNAQIYPVGGAGQAKSFSPHKSRNLADVAETVAGLHDRNPREAALLTKYLQTGGHGMTPRDSDWCAAFLGATVQHAGMKGITAGRGGDIATNWMTWGDKIRAEEARRGDIMVGGRRPGEKGGHVAIVTGPAVNGKIPVIEGDRRDDEASYATSPGSLHSLPGSVGGKPYTGGHHVGRTTVDAADPGIQFRRPPTLEAEK